MMEWFKKKKKKKLPGFAKEKMTDHQFLNADRTRQRTEFSDGTQVTVDFADHSFLIRYPDGEEVTEL